MIVRNGKEAIGLHRNGKEGIVAIRNGKIGFTKRVDDACYLMFRMYGEQNTPTMLKDRVGDNNGTITNGVYIPERKTLKFDNTRVSFGGEIFPDFGQEFVVMRYSSQGSSARLSAETTTDGGYSTPYLKSSAPVNAISYYAPPFDNALTPTWVMPANILFHIFYRYSSTTRLLECFVNGVKVNEATNISPRTSTLIAYIGARNTNDRFFNGEFGLYGMHKRWLTDAEIMQNYIVEKFNFKIP